MAYEQSGLFDERFDVVEEDADLIEYGEMLIDEAYDQHNLDNIYSRRNISVATADWGKKLGSTVFNVKYPREYLGKRTPKRNKYREYGHTTIIVNDKFNPYDEHVDGVILHELAHVIANKDKGSNVGHGEKFKTWARKLGGVEGYASEVSLGSRDHKYEAYCPEGHFTTKYYRKGKVVKRPELYSCKICKSPIEVVQVR